MHNLVGPYGTKLAVNISRKYVGVLCDKKERENSQLHHTIGYLGHKSVFGTKKKKGCEIHGH